MPEKEYPLLTDDFVADLLSKEASDSTLKYSALGLDAYKSTKRPANQPKPNTRFLNNIIRDTNSHNRALLAKENAESQARLRDLNHAEEKKRREQERVQRRKRPDPADTRKRMLGDIAAIIGAGSGSSSSKRHRAEDEFDTTPTDQATSKRERSPETSASRNSKRIKSQDRHDRDRTRHQSRKGDVSRESSSLRRLTRRHPDDKKPMELFPDSNQSKRGARNRGSKTGDENPSVPCEVDSQRHRRRRSSFNTRDTSDSQPSGVSRKKRDLSPTSDSDPLDDIIGPAPPSKPDLIRPRGRGANAASSGIDSRFAPDYDPSSDVRPGPGDTSEDNWDNAVEAFRDRLKWKNQAVERLRAAGFTDDELKQWEKGEKKDGADVQWNKHGGVREWDRGKVVDTDGDISVEAEWGRLRDT